MRKGMTKEEGREKIDVDDVERINRAADELSAEAEDVLRYQTLSAPSRRNTGTWTLKLFEELAHRA